MTEDGDGHDIPDHLTVGELRGIFGDTAVDRSMQYLESLREADRRFREETDAESMTEGYRKAGVEGDVSDVSEKWKSQIEEEGLGLDD